MTLQVQIVPLPPALVPRKLGLPGPRSPTLAEGRAEVTKMVNGRPGTGGSGANVIRSSPLPATPAGTRVPVAVGAAVVGPGVAASATTPSGTLAAGCGRTTAAG